MVSLHQLIFWFVIKNVIPRGQGRNLADTMDQYFTDLMDREAPINLPAIMICYIVRIVNTTREHDLAYKFLLTRVFEHFGVELQKKVGVQIIDTIGSNTLMRCGLDLARSETSASEHGHRKYFTPVSGRASREPPLEVLLQDNTTLKTEVTVVKEELAAEREQNAKRHDDLLSLLSALSAKLSPPTP